MNKKIYVSPAIKVKVIKIKDLICNSPDGILGSTPTTVSYSKQSSIIITDFDYDDESDLSFDTDIWNSRK